MAFNIFPQTLCSGDIYPLKLIFTDKATGLPRDLTGSTVGATVKVEPGNDPDIGALWKQDVNGDTTGVVQFYVGPLAAGDYWFDVKMRSGASRTTILAPLQLHILQSVTAR